MEITRRYESPLGGITLAGEGDALTGLWFDGQAHWGETLDPAHREGNLPVLDEAVRWLDICFSGREPDFTPPLAPKGTAFRRAVWEALREIPRGETRTYGQIAETLARRESPIRTCARAVGGAVARNPVSLIIPCHRVIGADGGLTGYAAGTERKRKLLEMEQK